MTPLMMAAYKSNKDLCSLFIKHGANVNSSAHQHGYTALMFAALTGQYTTLISTVLCFLSILTLNVHSWIWHKTIKTFGELIGKFL